MALANTNAIVKGSDAFDASFVPELWSDEVVSSYKKNLVFANLVRKLNHKGKKGDAIYIPQPTRGDATRRSDVTAAYTVAPLAYADDTRITVAIDKHTEYSRLFDDFAEVQALESMRRFFTDDAGYSIARAIDTDIINGMLAKNFSVLAFDSSTEAAYSLIDQDTSTYTASSAIDGAGTAVAAYNVDSYADITDAGIRVGIRTLDTNDVPMMDRVWVVRPEVKETLLGLPRFTEQAFTGEAGGGNSIRNGLVGNVYAMPVYVTNQLPRLEAATGDDTIAGHVSMMFHRDSTVLVEQMGVRIQKEYQLQYLADLMVADVIYGVKNLRDSSIVTYFTAA